MTFTHPRFPGSLAVAGVFALGAGGCATSLPPTEQMAVARASVAGANAGGAHAYAPTELLLATDRLASAQKAMADKDYSLALQFAEQAHTDAQLAVRKTQSARARIAADDAQAAARVVHEEMNAHTRRTRPGGTQ
jgi:hypothetical protein